jgi:hypothetical protein
MLKYLLLWFVMLVIASANGGFREAWLKARFPDLLAHQISTVLLAILFTLFTYLVIRTWRPASEQMAWGIGLMWLVLTLIFEFGFGHYVANKPWSELLEEYNLFAGRIWIIIPVLILTLPVLFHRLLR